MALPEPKPGLVLNYAYLWRDQVLAGRDEGVKDRPCVVILSIQDRDGDRIVSVVPITHSEPRAPDQAVELPRGTKRRLGLDDAQSWIVTSEINRFIWPGSDLRPVRGRYPVTVAHGFIPGVVLQRVRDQILERRGLRITTRE